MAQLPATHLETGVPAQFLRGGVRQIDGDLLDITFVPTTYTRDITGSPGGATNVEELSAHLNGIDLKFTTIDHGTLTGLADDDHLQYALLAGRAGGQTLIGGTGTTDKLTLRSTSGVGATGADIIFQVGNNGATEAMRIDNTGALLIGATSPTGAVNTKLQVSGDFAGRIRTFIENTNATSKSAVLTMSVNSTVGLWEIGTDFFQQGDDNLYIFGGGSGDARMFFNGAGNVGIGMSTPDEPDEKFHVAKAVDGSFTGLLVENSQANTAGSVNETAEIRFGFGGNNDVARIVAGKESDFTSAANEDSFLAFSTKLNGAIQEVIRIRALEGFVGIGTTVPNAKLDITGTAQDTGLSKIGFNLHQKLVDLGSSDLNGPLLRFRTDNAFDTWATGGIVGVIGTPADTSGFPGGLAFRTKAGDGNVDDVIIERMRLDHNGRLGIGTTTPDRALEISGASNNTASVRISSFGSGFSSRVEIQRANGTEGTPTAVFAGNQLGQIAHRGYDGTSFADAALIHGVANENWAVGSHGSRLEFVTILDGTTAFVTRMTIANDGNVGIGTTGPTELLEVAGSILGIGATPGLRLKNTAASLDNKEWLFTATTFGGVGALGLDLVDDAGSSSVRILEIIRIGIGTGGAFNFKRPVSIPDGTAAIPSLRFEDDVDTGIYRPATNVIGFSTGGADRLQIEAAGTITISTGSAITVSPTSTASNKGWKLGFFSTTFGVGISAETMELKASAWVALSNANSADDGNTVNPQTGAAIAFDTVKGSIAQKGSAAPALSVSGSGRFYFDSTANKFKFSENASAYQDLIVGSGTTGKLPKFTAGSTLGDSLLSDDGTNITLASGQFELVMGASTGFSVMGGVADSQFTDVGNVGAGEDTLQTFTLPANALNADGKAIRIRASFKTAANANVKTIKLHFGGTVLASSGAADINNRIIYFDAVVVRTGTSAQRSTAFRIEGVSGAFSDNTLVIRTNPAETTTGAIVIKGTGEGVANNDVVQESMLVEFLN